MSLLKGWDRHSCKIITKNYKNYLATIIFQALRKNFLRGNSVTYNSLFKFGCLFICLSFLFMIIVCLVLMPVISLRVRHVCLHGRQNTGSVRSCSEPAEWVLCSSIMHYLLLLIWIIQLMPKHGKGSTITSGLQGKQGRFSPRLFTFKWYI